MFFSLRNRIFLIFTLLLTVPFLIVSIMIPTRFTRIMEEQTKNNTIEKMDQYSLYIDSITAQVEDLGKQVLVNQATRDWINADSDISNTEKVLLKNQLKMQLSSMMVNNSNSISIAVFLNDGTGTWGNNHQLNKAEWFQNFQEKDQKWVKAHMDPYQLSQEMKESSVISYLLPLFNISTLEAVGVIKVNFPSKALENALTKIKVGEKGRVYVVDQSGTNILPGKIKTPRKVLSQSLEEMSEYPEGKGLIETTYKGEDYLVFYQKLSVGNWVLISEVTKSELFAKIVHLQRNLFIICALIFIATILASYMQSSTIVKPLEMLRKAMGYIEHGDFNGAKRFMKTIKPYKHEVGYAINIFGHTVDRLNHLIATEYEANLRRKNAEYKALLLQINPHFLNNTLEIMGGLAAQGKNEEVVNVSVYLGRMMRYSLNTSNDIVPLKEEISYIRNFTNILKLRYEDTIDIKIEEDPSANDIPIIKFIVQPLVENAVKYSLQGKRPPEILIKTECIKDTLFLLIQDNGIGMASDVYKELMYMEQNNESSNVLNSSGNSIGLKNVLGRLKLYYGDKFTYDIQTEHNEGTSIVLCIQLTKEVQP
ncbi:cache domain-containing sensor histidine kinase [Niallia sp. 03133]|uniref:cache domain-containing sensor histidine kinase n=1 Tax=Niallia sp. 03133 TaxID=3458060 RepID=UPI004044ABC9